jgi:hypothetical protein
MVNAGARSSASVTFESFPSPFPLSGLSGSHSPQRKMYSPPVFGRVAAVHGNDKKRDPSCAKRIKHFQLNAAPVPTALGLHFLPPERNKEFEDDPFSSVPSGPDVLRIGIRYCTHGDDHL